MYLLLPPTKQCADCSRSFAFVVIKHGLISGKSMSMWPCYISQLSPTLVRDVCLRLSLAVARDYCLPLPPAVARDYCLLLSPSVARDYCLPFSPSVARDYCFILSLSVARDYYLRLSPSVARDCCLPLSPSIARDYCFPCPLQSRVTIASACPWLSRDVCLLSLLSSDGLCVSCLYLMIWNLYL